MEYPFFKAKLPRGFSYPLKRSVLDSFLDEAHLTQLSGVSFQYSSDGRPFLLLASFFGEAHKGFAEAGLCSLTLYSVPSAQKKLIEDAMTDSVLPRLVDWLRLIDQKGNAWRAKSRHLEFRNNDGAITYREYPT